MFNTERVVHWCFLIEKRGPDSCCIKGKHDVVANALSCLGLKEEEFFLDAFTCLEADACPVGPDDDDFPSDCPLLFKQIAHVQ